VEEGRTHQRKARNYALDLKSLLAGLDTSIGYVLVQSLVEED
jgi:hypothetical protein